MLTKDIRSSLRRGFNADLPASMVRFIIPKMAALFDSGGDRITLAARRRIGRLDRRPASAHFIHTTSLLGDATPSLTPTSGGVLLSEP
jgi:hypothetical protein